MTDWLTGLTVVTALFTAIAALANSIQARRAAQANNVAIYLQMLESYGSPEMRDAISSLAAFWRERKTQYPNASEAYTDYFALNKDGASELRGHSRRLSAYFMNAARLYEAGIITRRFLLLLINHAGLNVFYDVAVPINLIKSPHHNSGKYAVLLKSVLSTHGNGIF
jgi:hypothetical protein